jgi:hypothetical protein
MASNIEYVKELLESRLDNLDEKIDLNNKSISEKIDSNNKNINEKIDTNNHHLIELLGYIREQTTKTNGRVTKNEDDIKRITSLVNDNFCNYPGRREIDKINEKLQILDDQNLIIKVWNKYPKALVTGIVVSVLIVIGTLSYTLISVHNMIQKFKTEEKTTESLKNSNNENNYLYSRSNN